MMQAEKYVLRRPHEAVLTALHQILSSKKGNTIYVYPTLIARILGVKRSSVPLLTLIMSILDELPFATRVDGNGDRHKRRYYAINRRQYEKWVRQWRT